MQISSRFTIAMHIFAACDYFKDTQKVTSQFLAGSVNVNPVIIRKIMSQLRDAGLINVQRGTGGITLTRDPEDITLLDVFKAVDSVDDEQLFHFHENPNMNCPVGRNMHNVLDSRLDEVQKAMEDKLASMTLAEVFADTHKYADGEDS